MTHDELKAIRERAEKATKGPWTHPPYEEEIVAPGEMPVIRAGQVRGESFLCAEDADLDFIAAARTDIPALLYEIDRLRTALEAAKVYGRLDSYDAIEHRAAIDKALGGGT